MAYRIVAATIVLFWAAMFALLVRKEYGPRDSSLREVPVSHVLKAAFAHEQVSDLQIYAEKAVAGHLRLHPRMRKPDGARTLSFTGSLQMAVPTIGRQRFTWSGELELSPALQPRRLDLTASYRTPTQHTIELHFDFTQQQMNYETRVNATVSRRGRYSLDSAGARAFLREQGVDPDFVMSLHNPRSSPVAFRALESSLPIHGESVDTWQLSAVQGGLTLFEMHVNQLGQVMRLRSFLGYAAAPEDMEP